MRRHNAFTLRSILPALFLLPALAAASGVMESTPLLPAPERVLHVGSHGDDVTKLQQDLNIIFATSTPIPTTGYFGAVTEHRVRRFQAEGGIVNTGDRYTTGYGVMGPRTRTLLRLSALSLHCTWDRKPSRQACLEEFYRIYANTHGADEALRLIRAHVAREPYFDGSCHAEMHEIGHAAAHEYKTLGSAFTHGTPLCQNGYYHGVVEEYLRDRDIASVTPEELRGFCVSAAPEASSSQPTLNCVHGIGHALVYMTEDDLPRALLRCGDLATDMEQGECVAGAFMQDSFMGSTTPAKTKALQTLTSTCSQALFDGGKCWLTEGKKVIAGMQAATTTTGL